MKFSTRQDVSAPIDFVFDQVADFDEHERQALRRGLDIIRTDQLGEICVGMGWQLRHKFRNKLRQVDGELSRLERPGGFWVHSVSGGIKADFVLELMALSKGQTRMRVGLDVTPHSMKSRLLIQSVKLGKSGLDTRFSNRFATMAIEIEERYARNAAAR